MVKKTAPLISLILVFSLLSHNFVLAFQFPLRKSIAKTNQVSYNFTVHIVGESTSYFYRTKEGTTGYIGNFCNIFENNLKGSLYKNSQSASTLNKLIDFYNNPLGAGCETVWPQIRIVFESNVPSSTLQEFIDKELKSINLDLTLKIRDAGNNLTPYTFKLTIPTSTPADSDFLSVSPSELLGIVPFPQDPLSPEFKKIIALSDPNDPNNKSYFGFWIIVRSQYYFRDDIDLITVKNDPNHPDNQKSFTISNLSLNTNNAKISLDIRIYDDPASYRDGIFRKATGAEALAYFPSFIESLPPLPPEAAVTNECSYIDRGGVNILNPVSTGFRQELFQFNFGKCDNPPKISTSSLEFLGGADENLCFKFTNKSYICTLENGAGATSTSVCSYGLALNSRFKNAYLLHPVSTTIQHIEEFLVNLWSNPSSLFGDVSTSKIYFNPLDPKEYRILKKINTQLKETNFLDPSIAEILYKSRLYTQTILFSTTSPTYSYFQLNSSFPIIEECTFEFSWSAGILNATTSDCSIEDIDKKIQQLFSGQQVNLNKFLQSFIISLHSPIYGINRVFLQYKKFFTFLGEVDVYNVAYYSSDNRTINPLSNSVFWFDTNDHYIVIKNPGTVANYLIISFPSSTSDKLKNQDFPKNIKSIYLDGKLVPPQDSSNNIYIDYIRAQSYSRPQNINYSIPSNSDITLLSSLKNINLDTGFDILIFLDFKENLGTNLSSTIIKHDFRLISNVPRIYGDFPVLYVYEFNSSFSLRNRFDIIRYVAPNWNLNYSFGPFEEFTSRCTLPQFGLEPIVYVSTTQLMTQITIPECDIDGRCIDTQIEVPTAYCWANNTPLDISVILRKIFKYTGNQEDDAKTTLEFLTTALEYRTKAKNIQGLSFELIKTYKDKDGEYKIDSIPKILARNFYRTSFISEDGYEKILKDLASSTNEYISNIASTAKNLANTQQLVKEFIENIVAYFPFYFEQDNFVSISSITKEKSPQQVSLKIDPTVTLKVKEAPTKFAIWLKIFINAFTAVTMVASFIIPGFAAIATFFKIAILVLNVTYLAVSGEKFNIMTAVQLITSALAAFNASVDLGRVFQSLAPSSFLVLYQTSREILDFLGSIYDVGKTGVNLITYLITLGNFPKIEEEIENVKKELIDKPPPCQKPEAPWTYKPDTFITQFTDLIFRVNAQQDDCIDIKEGKRLRGIFLVGFKYKNHLFYTQQDATKISIDGGKLQQRKQSEIWPDRSRMNLEMLLETLFQSIPEVINYQETIAKIDKKKTISKPTTIKQKPPTQKKTTKQTVIKPDITPIDVRPVSPVPPPTATTTLPVSYYYPPISIDPNQYTQIFGSKWKAVAATIQEIQAVADKILSGMLVLESVFNIFNLAKRLKEQPETYIDTISLNFGYDFPNIFTVNKSLNPEENIMWLRVGLVGKKVYDPDYPEFGFYEPVRYFYTPTSSIIDLEPCSFVSCNFVTNSSSAKIILNYVNKEKNINVNVDVDNGIVGPNANDIKDELKRLYNFESISVNEQKLSCDFGFISTTTNLTTTTTQSLNRTTTTLNISDANSTLPSFIIGTALFGNYNLASVEGSINYMNNIQFSLPQNSIENRNFNTSYLLFSTINSSTSAELTTLPEKQILNLSNIIYSPNSSDTRTYNRQCVPRNQPSSPVVVKNFMDLAYVKNFIVKCSQGKPVYYGENSDKPTCLGWRCEFSPIEQPSLTSTIPKSP